MNEQELEKGARVVATPAQICDEDIRALFVRWQSKCDGHLPHPETFDAVDFPALARYWSWIDVIDGGADFSIRFLGSEIVHFIGREATGANMNEYREIVGERAVGRIVELARLILEHEKPALLGPRRSSIESRGWMRVLILGLPFSSDGQNLNRLLFANSFSSD